MGARVPVCVRKLRVVRGSFRLALHFQGVLTRPRVNGYQSDHGQLSLPQSRIRSSAMACSCLTRVSHMGRALTVHELELLFLQERAADVLVRALGVHQASSSPAAELTAAIQVCFFEQQVLNSGRGRFSRHLGAQPLHHNAAVS